MPEFNTFSLADVAHGANAMMQLKAMKAAQKQAPVIRELTGLAFGGDKEALEKLGAIDPDRASKVQDFMSKRSESEQKKIVDDIETRGRLLNYVQSQPPALRPAVYRQALAHAQNRGMDISNVPQEYDPTMVNMMISETMQMKDMITTAQKDVMARGLQRGTDEFNRALEKETANASGGKFTKSDRIMQLANKMANRKATKEEEEEYNLLINSDPIERLMRKMTAKFEEGMDIPAPE